jgi:hypothetical protein
MRVTDIFYPLRGCLQPDVDILLINFWGKYNFRSKALKKLSLDR